MSMIDMDAMRLDGFATYQEARAAAQQYANATGSSLGLEKPGKYGDGRWYPRMLPHKANRCGWELRCEVVAPDNNEVGDM